MDSPALPPPTIPPRRSSLRRFALLGGLFFLTGLVVMAWGLTQSEMARTMLFGRPAEALPPPAPVIPFQPNAVTSAPGVPDIRVAALEQRLASIDQQASAASIDVARAERLLIAFAARRAVERGVGLGYLESALQQRFGSDQPQAVEAIVAASRSPVTVDSLKTGLADIAPVLAGQAPGESWWRSFRRSLSGLVVVRDDGAPSPAPAQRLARAEGLLDGDRVDLAIAEVSRMPGAGNAQQWLDSARTYASAHRALDILEATALSSGRPPEEPTP